MIKKINIPIFFGTLVLFQDYDMKKACQIMGFKEDHFDYDAISGHEVDKDGHLGYGIIFDKCTPSIIAHEAVHTAHQIIETHDMSNDEELMAYLTGWVVEQCHKYLKVQN